MNFRTFKLYFFPEGIGLVGIEDFVAVHHSDKILGVGKIDDVVSVAGKHVDGFNLVEDCSDAKQYKKVLEMIFDKLDQKQHYDMMTAKKR